MIVAGLFGRYTSDAVNYNYTHCVGFPFVDIVFSSYQGNTVSVGGQCYTYDSLTSEAATDPSVTAAYSSCALCQATQTNEIWRNSGGSAIAVLSPSHTADDYAWLCEGGVWTKAYHSGMSSSTATDPTVLEQCGTTPTSLGDLKGWPASDDFGGTGCNSGAVGDGNYSVRWYPADGHPTYTISGGNANYSGAIDYTLFNNIENSDTSGDFTITMDHVITSLSSSTSSRHAYFYCKVGSAEYSLYILGSTKRLYWSGGGSSGNIANSATSISYRLQRISGTLTLSYDTGAGWQVVKSSGNTGQITPLRFIDWMRGGAAGSGYWDNFVAVDGSSNDIYIDPTGEACS